MHHLPLMFLLMALAASRPSAADEVQKGRDMAGRMCAVCHMNEGQGEKRGPTGIPSFAAIANRPAQDHEQVVRWLRSRPTMMPDHHLTWDEADALAAFIMTLRKAK